MMQRPQQCGTADPRRAPFSPRRARQLLVEIGQCLRQCRAEALDRESTLFRLATTVDGIYVPQFYDAPGGCVPGLQEVWDVAPCGALRLGAPPASALPLLAGTPASTLSCLLPCRSWGGAVFPNREGVPPRVKRRVCAPDPFQQARRAVGASGGWRQAGCCGVVQQCTLSSEHTRPACLALIHRSAWSPLWIPCTTA